MFQNSNARFVIQLSKKNYRSNKSRNFVSILAIILTSFMIITVFSVGFSYINAYKLQQLQLLGTTGDASLSNPSSEQIETLKQNSKVKNVGIREDVIRASDMEYLKSDKKLYYAFRYYDDTEWKNHRKPVLENIVGNYPQKENEIMIPTWALHKMGIGHPKVGGKYSFSYKLKGIRKSEQFVLSGYFGEYDNSTKSGSIVYALVSKKFVSINKDKLIGTTSIADISFKNKIEESDIENIKNSLNLQDKQIFSVNPRLQSKTSVDIVILVSIILCCIVMCGYLLIYNIFSISITNNIHYYGQLKVIGVTQKQIRDILLLQGVKLASYGITIGGVLGYLFCNFMVPIFINHMLGRGTETITCNLLVILGTVIFTAITVLIAVLKPASIAGKISPIEATRYERKTNIQIKKVRKRKRPTHFHMAIENVFRDKKRSCLVFLSMMLGITSCLMIGVLVSSMNTDNYVKSNMDSDIVLTNGTIALGYDKKIAQVFDTKFISSLKNIEGISKVSTIKQQLIAPVYDDNVLGKYVKTIMPKGDVDNGYFKNHPGAFFSQLIGIEVSESLKSKYPQINWAAFEKGKICLIPCNTNNLIEEGKKITFRLGNYDNSSRKAVLEARKYTINIGGFLPESYNNYGAIRTVAPHLVVSQKYLESIKKDAIITNVMIDTYKQSEKEVNRLVSTLINNSHFSDNIVEVSALEKMDGLKQTKITLYGMGGSIAVVLAMIGIINFINVIYTSVYERKRDFTIMESIGLEKKQIIHIVTCESLIYFCVSILLVLTIGNIIILVIYHIFSKVVTYAEFSYPFGILLGSVLFLFLICYYVPQKAIGKNISSTIVERLKINE